MMRTLYDAFIGVLAASGIDEELGTSHFRRVRRAFVRSDIFNIEGVNVTPRGLYANANEMPPTVRAETPEKIDPKILPLVKDLLKCCLPLMKEEPRDNIAEGSFFMDPDALEAALLSHGAFAEGRGVLTMGSNWDSELLGACHRVVQGEASLCNGGGSGALWCPDQGLIRLPRGSFAVVVATRKKKKGPPRLLSELLGMWEAMTRSTRKDLTHHEKLGRNMWFYGLFVVNPGLFRNISRNRLY